MMKLVPTQRTWTSVVPVKTGNMRRSLSRRTFLRLGLAGWSFVVSLLVASAGLLAQGDDCGTRVAADFTGDETWACRKKHLAVVNPVCGNEAGRVISLRGEWEFLARTDQRTRRNSHDVPFFPDVAPWNTARTIQVPGCWEAQGVDKPGESEPWAFRLDCSQKPLRHVLFGEGWYRKKVRIPEAWRDKRVWIKVGGLNARGWIWVNRQQAAHVDNYCGTYKYDVTDCVTPGDEAEIIVEVDNRLKGRKGCFNNVNRWGGIYRDIELEATPQTFIDDAWIRGDFDAKVAEVHVVIGRAGSPLPADGRSRGDAPYQIRVTIDGQTVSQTLKLSNAQTFKLPLADFRPWSPEHPNLYTGIVELVENGKVVHTRRERFGVRKFEVRGKEFYLNGKPFFVRGIGDDSVYPITGVPPADREFHLRHLLKAHHAGFNFVRLHTHCEVPEYFEAADEAGILVQPELPYINGDIPTEDEVEFDPIRDLLELHANYRRYVSFAVYSNGNEGSFGRRLDEYLYALAKKLDPDRLKIGMDTQFARFNPKGVSDYEGGPVSEWPRGSINPEKPFVCHEYLNRTVKLDARLEERFSGVWAPPVTCAQRAAFLADAGLDADWGDRLQRAQHALQRYWHKSGVESARADPFCDGYCLWTIVDVVVRQGKTFTSQGVFNPFWEAKDGGATPESLALFNSPSVVLLDVKGNERVFRSGDSCQMDFLFAHYGDAALKGAVLEWSLETDAQERVPPVRGCVSVGDVALGPARKVASEKIVFPTVEKPVKATLSASVGGKGLNSWEFWLFPRRDLKDGSFIAVSDAIRPAFSTLYANVRSEAEAEQAEIVVAEEGSPLLAAASKRGQRTLSLGDVDRSPLGRCRFWEVGREIDAAAQEAYRTPSQDVSLGWWSMRNQVGTALRNHPALALLPHEGFLSPLLFGTIGKGRKLPFAGADAESLIIVSEGRDTCYAHLAEIGKGCHLASWGLDLLSGRPESTAILDGMISYLGNRDNGK